MVNLNIQYPVWLFREWSGNIGEGDAGVLVNRQRVFMHKLHYLPFKIVTCESPHTQTYIHIHTQIAFYNACIIVSKAVSL